MSKQRQFLTLALVLFAFLGGGAAMGYFVFYQPILEKNRAADKLAADTLDQEAKLAALRKNQKRLEDARRRSLPADLHTAESEYQAVLEQLLHQAKAPAGSPVKHKSVDNKSTPSLAGTAAPGAPVAPGAQAAKKVYTRVAFEITMTKCDLWSLVDFLQAYYKLNLLQQITSINVKRDDSSSTAAKRTQAEADRKDLTVTIVTEAMILDGAESRRSVLPVPTAFAAVGGWAGQQLVSLTPEAGRRLTPIAFAPVLATRSRDYSAMLAHDPFHGPLPPPKPKVEIKKEERPPPPMIEVDNRPDFAPYIKLVDITQRGDGTAAVEVRDLMNNTVYEVQYSPLRVEVKRYSGTASRRQLDRFYRPSTTFQIFDNESSTVRNYRVVGVESNALFLTDAKEKLPPISGIAALGGGVTSAVPPPGKLFRWKLGESLQQVTQADPSEMQRVLNELPSESFGPVAIADDDWFVK